MCMSENIKNVKVKMVKAIGVTVGMMVSAAILCLATLLSGCAVNKYVAKQQYLLHVADSASSLASSIKVVKKVGTQKGKANIAARNLVVIAPVTIAAAFDQQNFLYRVSDNQYLVDYYNSFLIAPVRQMDDFLAQYLNATKKFKAVTSRDVAVGWGNVAAVGANVNNDTYGVRVKILELYADYRDRNRPQAVIALQVSLVRLAQQRAQQVKQAQQPATTVATVAAVATMGSVERTWRVAVPLTAKDSDSLLAAWGKGMETLFARIAESINQY